MRCDVRCEWLMNDDDKSVKGKVKGYILTQLNWIETKWNDYDCLHNTLAE